jgi:hypothetical protein
MKKALVISATRRNLCLLIVGRKFTGKTTIALELAAASGKAVIIVDTDEHPTYAEVPIVPLEKLKTWKGTICRVIERNTDQVFAVLNEHQANAFIIFEDAAKYIDSNVQRVVRAFIIDHRKRNFDIAFMFHFLADVPPYICKQYDRMLLFKTGDSLDRQAKFANWHSIAAKMQRINAHKDFHHCDLIDIDE